MAVRLQKHTSEWFAARRELNALSDTGQFPTPELQRDFDTAYARAEARCRAAKRKLTEAARDWLGEVE